MSAHEGHTRRPARSQEGTSVATNASAVLCADFDGPRAIAEVARIHHSKLLRLLTVRAGSSEDAKDILQEAYTKLLLLDRPESIHALVAYTWRIAMNLVIDRGRRRALDQRFRRALPDDRRQEFSTEAVIESRERLSIVGRAISELPPRCLEAFLLHVHKGMTFAEVGKEMGITVRMAQKHLARALEYLQSCLNAADTTRAPLPYATL